MSFFKDIFHLERQPEPTPKLNPRDVWQLSPSCDGPSFLRALRLLSLTNGTVAFEGTTDKKIAGWLASNADRAGLAITAGTMWPASDWWFLPLDGRLLDQLASELGKETSASIHLYVYDGQGLVIEWYDAFDEPLWIARRVGDAALAQFVAVVGGALEPTKESV
jgi:hypothetical protein